MELFDRQADFSADCRYNCSEDNKRGISAGLNAVRDLALEAGVNPNTMQRALTTAEDGGIIYVRRGEGRYVTEDTEKIAAYRTEYVLKQTREFAARMKSLGLDGGEISAALNSVLNGEE